MKIIYLFSLLLIIASCSLNGDQEAALNKSTMSYIDFRNEGILISYTALVHPNAVGYYHDLGDEAFKKKFDLNNASNSLFLQDGNIRDTESSGDEIHVKYEFLGIGEYEYTDDVMKVYIYAISSDSGVTWHYLDDEDYMNDKIIEPKNRLIK